MGGMQTFQWMVAYPDFIDKAIPIVGSPRLTSYDLLLWTTEVHAIESDAAWMGGDYVTPPKAAMATVTGQSFVQTLSVLASKKAIGRM